MYKMIAITYSALLCAACTSNKTNDSAESMDTGDNVVSESDSPITADSTYSVLTEEDIVYAEGLAMMRPVLLPLQSLYIRYLLSR